MSWLKRLESFWGRLFEGLFRREGNGVQPVEIAKHLARTMHINRTVSISRVYVPNTFLVYLSLKDWERLFAFAGALATEMEVFLQERAAGQGYTMVGDPKVEFEIDESLEPGEIAVHCQLEEKVIGEGVDHTLVYTPLGTKNDLAGDPNPPWELVASNGPDKGRSFLLRSGKQVIGRNPVCEFVLTDGQVSRRHCQLEAVNGQVILTDLGSRNQTLLNGKPINRALVKPGDEIVIGETVLEVRVV